MNNFVIELPKINSPKSIINEQNEYLKKLTEGKVFIKLEEYRPIVENITGNVDPKKDGKMKEYVNYKFLLKTKYEKNYSFRVFLIRYTVSIYHVEILDLDSEIQDQLQLYKKPIAKSEKDLKDILKKIFNSQKMVSIITILMSDKL